MQRRLTPGHEVRREHSVAHLRAKTFTTHAYTARAHVYVTTKISASLPTTTIAFDNFY